MFRLWEGRLKAELTPISRAACRVVLWWARQRTHCNSHQANRVMSCFSRGNTSYVLSRRSSANFRNWNFLHSLKYTDLRDVCPRWRRISYSRKKRTCVGHSRSFSFKGQNEINSEWQVLAGKNKQNRPWLQRVLPVLCGSIQVTGDGCTRVTRRNRTVDHHLWGSLGKVGEWLDWQQLFSPRSGATLPVPSWGGMQGDEEKHGESGDGSALS